jgi:hypothetical protein
MGAGAQIGRDAVKAVEPSREKPQPVRAEPARVYVSSPGSSAPGNAPTEKPHAAKKATSAPPPAATAQEHDCDAYRAAIKAPGADGAYAAKLKSEAPECFAK